MFDLFGKKKRHKDQYDRAYAEYKLGRNNIALNILTRLISENTKNANVYSLSGEIYFDALNFPKALSCFNKSISIDPNIKTNDRSYFGRETIIKMLESGQIEAHIPDLINYFQPANIAMLIFESAESIKEDFPQLSKGVVTKFQILALEYSLMRILHDKDFTKLNSSNIKFIDSTIRVQKSECEGLMKDMKLIIQNEEIRSLTSMNSFNYMNQIMAPKSESRILILATLYLSPWCKDIKKPNEKFEFLKNYFSLKEVKETYENLIEIRNFIFGRAMPTTYSEMNYDEFRNVDTLIKDERIQIILHAFDQFKLFHETPMIQEK